jgi:hypothetical protein
VQEADDADEDEQVAEDEDETSETIFAKSTAKRRRAQSASGAKRVKVTAAASAVAPVKKTTLGNVSRVQAAAALEGRASMRSANNDALSSRGSRILQTTPFLGACSSPTAPRSVVPRTMVPRPGSGPVPVVGMFGSPQISLGY